MRAYTSKDMSLAGWTAALQSRQSLVAPHTLLWTNASPGTSVQKDYVPAIQAAKRGFDIDNRRGSSMQVNTRSRRDKVTDHPP